MVLGELQKAVLEVVVQLMGTEVEVEVDLSVVMVEIVVEGTDMEVGASILIPML